MLLRFLASWLILRGRHSVDEIMDLLNLVLHTVNPHLIARECLTVAMASQPRTLLNNEVHIWHADVWGIKFNEGQLSNLLSPDELARISRFQYETDRRNFLFCRSMLRILLASYLRVSPAELHFAYSAHGKPNLAASAGKVEFNLSHSEGQLLIAICRNRKVGVDIERTDLNLNVTEVAQQFFSQTELRRLEAEPPHLRRKFFYSCWTQKEAWLKARGEGLSYPLSTFDVCESGQAGEVKLTTRPNAAEALRWSIYKVPAPQGFTAALALERQPRC